MRNLFKLKFTKFFFAQRGAALIEFVFVAPLLLVLFFGSVELARYIIIMQKVERSAFALSNMTVQYRQVASHIDDPFELDPASFTTEIFPQFKKNMEPYITDVDRVAIITSITRRNNGNSNNSILINWQVAGGGSMDSVNSVINGLKPSQIPSASPNGAAAGTNPTFPMAADPVLMDGALSAMAMGENMIITEVFYSYQPMVSGILGNLGSIVIPPQIFKSVVYARPRQGDINTLVRPNPPPTVATTCTISTLPTPVIYCYPPVDDTTTCMQTVTCITKTELKTCTTCTTTYEGVTTCDAPVSSYNVDSETWANTVTPIVGCTPPPNVTTTCAVTPIQGAIPTCNTSTDLPTCTDTTTCSTCTDQDICTTCTTPFNGATTCVVSSTTDINCSVSSTSTAPTPNCTPAPPQPPPPPPPPPPVG